MKNSKIVMFTLILVFSCLSPLVHAKFVLTGQTHPAISPENIRISFYDRGQYKNCEEMGMVHSQNAFSLIQTKKGMLTRIKKQAAKSGVTDILMTQSKLGEFWGVQQGEGVAFYCPTGKK